jgi:hypothetical protein
MDSIAVGQSNDPNVIVIVIQAKDGNTIFTVKKSAAIILAKQLLLLTEESK